MHTARGCGTGFGRLLLFRPGLGETIRRMNLPLLPSRWLIFSALALGAAPLVLLSVPGTRPRDLLLREYRERLAHVSLTDRGVLLRGAVQFGADGLPLLVESLYADDESLADAAYGVLNEQLDQWLLEKPGIADAKLARLAQLLADRSGQGREATRQQAVRLAGRMLLAPVSKNRQASRRVVHCEQILRSSARQTVPELSGRSPGGKDAEVPVSVVAAPTESQFLWAAVDESQAQVPSESDARAVYEPAAIVPPSAPRIHAVEPNESGHAPNTAMPKPRAEGELASPEAGMANRPRLSELADRELMSHLLDEHRVIAAAAADELRARGYQPLHLELARRLVDPDPAVRRTLLEDLPRLRSVDPRRWLVWLTRDADPDVRRATIAIIAASGDPELWKQLETVRSAELDPEVLRFVCRILEDNPRAGRW